MTRTKEYFKRNIDVFSKKIDSKWYILEGNKKFVLELNQTAGYIWELLKKPVSVNIVADKLHQQYSIGKAKALKDTVKFIKHYLKKILLIFTIITFHKSINI